MTDLSHTQSLDTLRATIAAKTAAYESEFGPVQTLPIYIGDRPAPSFTITAPGKPKAHQQSQKLRAADHKRVTLRTQKKMAKVQKIRELAVTGMKIADMAERLDMTAKYVQRIILEHGLPRGRDAARGGAA